MDGSRYDGGDPEILKVNFFRGLRDDRLREALQPRKEELMSFNQMLKEARRLESDQSKCKATSKVGINAVTEEENKVSNRDWLETRFQKMETKLQNEVKAQIASVQQMTSQPQQNNGQGRGRGGFRGRGNRGGYRGTHHQAQGTNDRQQGARLNHPPQENNNHVDDWDPSQIVCYTCGGVGHYQNGCAFRGRGQNPNYRGSGRGGHC